MKLSTKQQLLKDASSELKRLRKLAGLSESKTPLNEGIIKVLKDVSKVEGDKIYDAFSSMNEKFYAEQTKRLNNLHKTELQKYVGKKLTSGLVDKLINLRNIEVFGGKNPPIGDLDKKITSISFFVTQGFDSPEIRLVIQLEGGKSFEYIVYTESN